MVLIKHPTTMLQTCVILPDVLNDLIISFVPFHWLVSSHLYMDRIYTDKHEFYKRKPRFMFGEMVWLERLLHEINEPGLQLYAIEKFKYNYGGVPEACELWSDVPTETNILRNAFEKIELHGHEMCNAGFRQLLGNTAADLSDEEVVYIDSHFVGEWSRRIEECLYTNELEWIFRRGFGPVAFAMINGIVRNNSFLPETRAHAGEFLVQQMIDARAHFEFAVLHLCGRALKELAHYMCHQSDNSQLIQIGRVIDELICKRGH